MKAVLVLDEMPKSCEECLCRMQESIFGDYFCLKTLKEIKTAGRPSWCPLRPLPSKLVPFGYLDAGNEDGLYEKGYNDCIDEITGKTE